MSSWLQKLPNTFRAFYGTFSALRPAQEECIEPLLEGRDLLLQAPTGSGKTEAVLAPVLERIMTTQYRSCVLYIVPTRALALDLQRRLQPVVVMRLGLGIAVRTGDSKRDGGAEPAILITTPESLDVALGSQNQRVRSLLGRTTALVIDEVHPLLYTHRGVQLGRLIERLERRLGRRLQRVAMSATIGDPAAVKRFFDFSTDFVSILHPIQRDIRPYIATLQTEELEFASFIEDLIQQWNYKKLLIFCNSRARCDSILGQLAQHPQFSGRCELHYSNLKLRERKLVEERFRKLDRALCIATSTLELGIDVGDVDAVVLYEPPESIAAFLQRIGRANRREHHTNVWCICRGVRAQVQLLRFLALIYQARGGHIERSVERFLPSVLVQQLVSCLYEYRSISKDQLVSLLPGDPALLESIIAHLVKKGWFRPGIRPHFFEGGRRFWEAVIDCQIWSNFPEEEDSFQLQFEGDAIADLPASIVRQLEPGKQVHLAGRRQYIELIEKRPIARVVSRICNSGGEADLMWLGSGPQVSFDVAQGAKAVFASARNTESKIEAHLFNRPRRQFEQLLRLYKRSVLLANDLRVTLSPRGSLYYYTFLGSCGNALLKLAIKQHLGDSEDAVLLDSDEFGLESSSWLDFQSLDLPTSKTGLRKFVAELPRARAEAELVNGSLTSWVDLLPRPQVIDEITELAFDPRILECFRTLTEQSADIVEGDARWLEAEAASCTQSNVGEPFPALPHALLEHERQRWQEVHEFKWNTHARYVAKTITGTLVGEYHRHRQCSRFIRLHFLDPADKPPAPPGREDDLLLARAERGRTFERQAQEWLQQNASTFTLDVIAETDPDGRARSIRDRFQATKRWLESLPSRDGTYCLISGVLMRDLEWTLTPPRVADPTPLLAVGIPDLLLATVENGTIWLQVGDIKDSQEQKTRYLWQVAFYAYLLGPMVAEISSFWISIRPTGRLLLRSARDFQWQEFILEPYLLMMPQLMLQMDRGLQNPLESRDWNLDRDCRSCPGFNCCYKEAVEHESIQFLPEITAGTLEILRERRVSTWEDLQRELDSPKQYADHVPDLSGALRRSLRMQLEVVRSGTVQLRHPVHGRVYTTRIPERITGVVALHLELHPLEGYPVAFGWRFSPLTPENASPDTASTFEALDSASNSWCSSATNNSESISKWLSFEQSLEAVWLQHIRDGRGPLLIFYGSQESRFQSQLHNELLQHLFEKARGATLNLRTLLLEAFIWPVPGKLNLTGILSSLGLSNVAANWFTPDLFQDSIPQSLANLSWQATLNCEIEPLTLSLQASVAIWERLCPYLVPLGTGSRWSSEDRTPSADYLEFLQHEHQANHLEHLRLQQLSVADRVDLFRALGPLQLIDTELDAEGRFINRLELVESTSSSRFRPGDFLVLKSVQMPVAEGFPVILVEGPIEGEVKIRSRAGRPSLRRQGSYFLEEDPTDWNYSRLLKGVQLGFQSSGHGMVTALLEGKWTLPPATNQSDFASRWIEQNRHKTGLNRVQEEALKQAFITPLLLVEGPPGTGKTHLLAWTLIALLEEAMERGCELRILIGALTHQAIDNVLDKVVILLNRRDSVGLDLRCVKLGPKPISGENPMSSTAGRSETTGAKFLHRYSVEHNDELEELLETPRLLLGATGFAAFRIFGGGKGEFPSYFHHVFFDEASQLLVPQAILSLLFGRGPVRFYGDIHQLPPIVLSPPDSFRDPRVCHSILEQLIQLYGVERRIRLTTTYRMNGSLCRFPSRSWYDGELVPDDSALNQTLALPAQPWPRDANVIGTTMLARRLYASSCAVSLVLLEHVGNQSLAQPEVELVSQLVQAWLLRGGYSPHQIALLSPHRAQNNAIATMLRERLKAHVETSKLEMPWIDTVERAQGSERDIIVYSLSTSHRDQFDGAFVTSPHRFNVALTRARKRLIVIGSLALFSHIPHHFAEMDLAVMLKRFWQHCEKEGEVIVCDQHGTPVNGGHITSTVSLPGYDEEK